MRPGDNYGGDRPLPPPTECRGTTVGAQCNGCPFSTREGHPNRPVVGEGAKNPLWIVVGEGPGSNESIFGRPFVGASGAVLDKVLTSIRRPRKDIWIANATLCLPTPDASEDLRVLAAQHCRERLRRELAQFPGVPILAVGSPATKILLEDVFKKADPLKEAPPAQAAASSVVPPPVDLLQPLHDRKDWPSIAPPGLFDPKNTNLSVKLRMALKQSADAYATRGDATAKEINAKRQKKAKKVKVEKIKKAKAPKIRRPRGTSKNKGLTFSDVVSTLHVSTFVGDHDPRQVIPTIHPAAILRSSGKALKGAHSADLVYWNLQYDAGKIDALAQGRADILFSEDVDTEISDVARATWLIMNIVAEAKALGEVAIDLETHVTDQQRHHALMMYVAEIKAIGVATPERAVSVMWDLLGPLAVAALRDLFLDPKVTKVFHNGNYDRTVLRARGFQLSDNWADSMLAHHATFPGMAHKLQLVAGQFYAIRPWKSEFRDSEETPATLTAYCGLDTLSTARLRAPLEILVRKTATEKVYEMDRGMAEIASSMHLNGVPMDREVNQDLLVRFRTTVKEAEEAIDAVANDPETLERIKHYIAMEQAHVKRKDDSDSYVERKNKRFEDIEAKLRKGKWKWSVDKAIHVVGLLRAIGVNLFKKTDSGRTATSKDILESLVDQPIVRRIVQHRENSKLLSTFVYSIFDRIKADGEVVYGYADENDRVHPSWSVTKISGRWASTEPVLSNVPKADFKKKRPNLRTQVVAPKGRMFVGFDFCLAPATRVLTSDLRWIPIGQVTKHDELIGFDEDLSLGRGVKFRRSKVEKVSRFRRPCYRVVTDKATVIASADHQWPTRQGKKNNTWRRGNRRWLTTEELRPGDAIAYATDPWESDTSYEGGYLAGFLDGEGWVSDGLAGWGQNAGPTRDHVLDLFSKKGFKEWSVAQNKTAGSCFKHVAAGAPMAGCRLVGTFRPPRLLADSAVLWEGKSTWGNRTRPAIVKSVEFVGYREVVGVRTSTRTFIAEGLLSHNCQLEARGIALVSGDPWLSNVVKQPNSDIHGEAMKVVWGAEKVAWLKANDPKLFKLLRDAVKRFEFGAFYGGSVETLWKTLLKDDQNAKLNDVAAAVHVLMTAMPGVVAWQDNCVIQASNPPNEIRSAVLGRRRVFPLIAERNEAINIGIQSLGADIMDTGMWRMWQRLPKYKGTCFPILQIHDAAIFECDEDDADRVLQDVEETFPQEYERNGQTIPFPIEAKIAKNWAEC